MQLSTWAQIFPTQETLLKTEETGMCVNISKFVVAIQWLIIKNVSAAVTILNDFGTQENKMCHCFHFVPIYLPWSDRTRCHDPSFLNGEFWASFLEIKEAHHW